MSPEMTIAAYVAGFFATVMPLIILGGIYSLLDKATKRLKLMEQALEDVRIATNDQRMRQIDLLAEAKLANENLAEGFAQLLGAGGE